MPPKNEDPANPAATLNAETQRALSQVLQDIRTTVAHLCLPGVSPLAVLDGTAVDALKDMYYIVNTEDPLNAMPARRLVLQQRVVKSALLPLVNAVHSDPSAQRNQKRWSVPMYQTLRLLSVLSLPIAKDNEFLKPGCNLDLFLLKLRADFAHDRSAIHAFVALLQYYIERKAEKQAALAAAEESKLEDARIDNILRFFRNILSPPRAQVGEDIMARDRGVHLALVAALVHSDFYSTLAILFSSKEDAAAHYTDLVFLVGDIYAQTYRHSTPGQMYQSYRHGLRKLDLIDLVSENISKEPHIVPKPKSVFDETPEPEATGNSVKKELKKPSKSRAKSSSIRNALQRERSFIGGSRAVRKSARWSSRFSGGFVSKPSPAPGSGDGQQSVEGQGTHPPDTSANASRNIAMKRVVSARNAMQSRLSLNPLRPFHEDVKVNSDILCMFAAKGRIQIMKNQTKKSSLSDTMRKDLQEEGQRGIVDLTEELVKVCFEHLMREMRARIEDTKTRALGDEVDALIAAQRAFLSIIGSVVGFQREKHGKVIKIRSHAERSLSAQMHENCMKSVLASDFKIVKDEWKPVEAGIEVESFRLVFRILIESCDSVKNCSKDDKKVQDVELSTFAILEMMKMLQGMTANRSSDGDDLEIQDGDKLLDNIRKNKDTLTSREIALNTIEQLFEQPEYLNAPADLAKDYTAKLFSFRHLTNIVEVTHAFTTILLDEDELARLQVARKKRARKTRKQPEDPSQKVVDDKEDDSNLAASEDIPSESKTPQNLKLNEGEVDEEELLRKLAGVERKESENRQDTAETQLEERSSPVLGSPEGSGEHLHGEKPPEEERHSPDPFNNVPVDREIVGTKENDVSENADKQENKEGPDGSENPESSDDESGELDEPELQEIESVGIIRRFAHAKAVQTLLLPIRAAICQASSLSGSIYNVPEGCGPLLSPVVTAKSAHVIAAVWRVAKVKERGAMCGQFFTFSTMHLMSIALEAAEQKTVLKESVMERFSVFARDVTRRCFSWIALSPGMALDMFFPMDKGTCQQYMTCSRQRDAVLKDRDGAADSGNDSDVSALAISRGGNLDFELVERRVSERNARKGRASTQLRKKVVERRRERGNIEEDEDVDDLDNLNLGNGLESSESESEAETNGAKVAQRDGDKEDNLDQTKAEAEAEGKGKETPFCRLPASKRRRSQATFDPFASDDEILQSRMQKVRKPRSKKAKKGGQERKEQREEKKRVEAGKVFSSSDEYAEVDLNGSDSEQEAGGRTGARRRRVKLVLSDSSG